MCKKKRNYDPNIWTDEELENFKTLLLEYGKDFVKLKELLPNKSRDEIIKKSHSLKLTLRKNSYIK